MNHRLERVCEVLKRELGLAIVRELNFGSVLVTVNSVDITSDLKHAHAFVSILGTPLEQKKALEKLEQNRGHLQNEIAKRVILKQTPHLHFKIDEALERGSRVLNIMNELGLVEEKNDDKKL